MSEETKTDDFPQTWDELKTREEYANIPDLVQAQEFSVAQSALFEVARTRVDERVRQASTLGLFDPDKATSDPDKAVVLVAEAVDYADTFFQALAKTKKDWANWVKGRELATLFSLFATLIRFYGEQLGKSSASATRTNGAASN